ncbi:MAG: DUF423 domain-containing protein [Verrucomicrobiota bacterium]|nr:DUF423 domain-containing protein [Verrucomicrobiota bacterium]
MSGIFGAIAIMIGAFGAHALKSHLQSLGTTAIFETAVLYHLAHAVALLALSNISNATVTKWCWACGIIVFSGSLYIMAVTNARWLGAITPIGGLLLIVGWLALCFQGHKKA